MSVIMSRLALRLTLGIFVFLSCLASFAHADSAWKPVEVLDSLHSVDEVAARQIHDLRSRGLLVKEIEVFHVSAEGEDPTELEAYLRWYARAFMQRNKLPNGDTRYSTVEIKIHRIKPKDLDAMMALYGEAAEPNIEEIHQALVYEDPSEFPALPKRTFRQKYYETMAKMRNFLGLAGGLSWVFYKAEWTKREKNEKLLEGAIAFAKTIVLSAVLINRLNAEDPTGHNINLVLALAGLAIPQMFFDYWQQGNADFKGQGLNIDTKTGKITTNQPFYYLIAGIHSVGMREMIVGLSRLTRHGLAMGWKEFRKAIETSVLGLFGKAPIEVYLQKNKHKHSKWWYIGRLTAFGLFYSSLQILDQFTKKGDGVGFGEYVRYLLATFGVSGLGYKLYQARHGIGRGFKNLFQRLAGHYQPPSRNCRSLLIFKVNPGTNPILQVPLTKFLPPEEGTEQP